MVTETHIVLASRYLSCEEDLDVFSQPQVGFFIKNWVYMTKKSYICNVRGNVYHFRTVFI